MGLLEAPVPIQLSKRAGNLLMGQGRVVGLQAGHRDQRTVYGLARRVSLDVPVGLRPPETHPHSLAYPPGIFWDIRPDRGRDAQHVGSANLIDQHIPEYRESVSLEGLKPTDSVFLVAPAGQVSLVNLARRLCERRDSRLGELGIGPG